MLPDLIEAAVRSGHGDEARVAFGELQEIAETSCTPWGLGVLARSAGILAEDTDPEAQYAAAIEHLSHCRARADLARTHLLYGEWLRRRKRRRDARVQLRAALDHFQQMGATMFASRALRELTATGEHLDPAKIGDRTRPDHPRNWRSYGWRPVAPPTPRSQRHWSSAGTPWITTCARSTGSSASPPAASSPSSPRNSNRSCPDHARHVIRHAAPDPHNRLAGRIGLTNDRGGTNELCAAMDGAEIYYKDWGSGRPVVLSHGWPLSSDSWEAQMLFLAANGFRVIAQIDAGTEGPPRPGAVTR